MRPDGMGMAHAARLTKEGAKDIMEETQHRTAAKTIYGGLNYEEGPFRYPGPGDAACLSD